MISAARRRWPRPRKPRSAHRAQHDFRHLRPAHHQTYLGACLNLTPADVDPDTIKGSKVVYLEGYLWDPPQAKEAFLQAARIAHGADRKVALTLSDSFCVERHRASFRDLVENHIDILIANEAEICSLWEVDSFDAALQATRGKCEVAALTRSEKGAVIFADGDVHVVDAAKVEKLVDTTGAGDLFAAGFLYGYTAGYNLFDAGRIGAIAAAEVISQPAARRAGRSLAGGLYSSSKVTRP
jgi:sugar/nucleoside kinase (ribokinase family)